jgi:hypothetical protein
MPVIGRIARVFGSLAIAFFIASLSNGAGLAGNATGAAPQNSAPTRLDPKASELSPTALGMEDEKHKRDKSGEEKPDLRIPDHIEFGDNVLHFDTKRKDPIPRVGVEADDQAIINKAAPDNSLKPDYFGLRFTTPLH